MIVFVTKKLNISLQKKHAQIVVCEQEVHAVNFLHREEQENKLYASLCKARVNRCLA